MVNVWEAHNVPSFVLVKIFLVCQQWTWSIANKKQTQGFETPIFYMFLGLLPTRKNGYRMGGPKYLN
jgi:hypothetical protein